MLNLLTKTQLLNALESTQSEFDSVIFNTSRFFEELTLIDPGKPGKLRKVVNVVGPLRALQTKFFCNVLKPNLKPQLFSHGGISGRNILTNAMAHLKSNYYFSADIEDFFPTISSNRIYRLFSGELACSSQVAWLCTKLCTYRKRLAQGLVTSPILADRILSTVDRRIATMCDKLSADSSTDVIYTRFVDDLTISAQFPLESGSTPNLLVKILEENGFRVNQEKCTFGRFADGGRITKLRLNRGKIDVSQEYLCMLNEQIRDARLLSEGKVQSTHFHSRQQVLGRVHFVGWISPHRLKPLLRQFKSIDWVKLEVEAMSNGLILSRKRIIKE